MGRCQEFPGLSGIRRLDRTITKDKISDYKIQEGVYVYIYIYIYIHIYISISIYICMYMYIYSNFLFKFYVYFLFYQLCFNLEIWCYIVSFQCKGLYSRLHPIFHLNLILLFAFTFSYFWRTGLAWFLPRVGAILPLTFNFP